MPNATDFEVCDRCADRAERPGEKSLCASCSTNQATIQRLARENAALIEVYVLAARMRMFPVPFDQHFELVGAVDECRSVLEPPIDNYNDNDNDNDNALPSQSAWQSHVEAHPRAEFLAMFREAHAALHRLWTDAVGKPGYDKPAWRAVDNALGRFARDAGEKVGISRSEPLL